MRQREMLAWSVRISLFNNIIETHYYIAQHSLRYSQQCITCGIKCSQCPAIGIRDRTIISNPPSQRHLSDMLEDCSLAFTTPCPAPTKHDFSRCLPLMPLPGSQLSLPESWDFTPCELNTVVKWWLGLNPH